MADTWLRSLWVAHLDVGPASVVSHEAAAALHGLASFGPGPLVLTVRHGAHQRPGQAAVHQSRDLVADHCSHVEGLPVTRVARTILDLAAVTGRHRLGLALDDGCSSRRCGMEEVQALHDQLRRPGKPGMRRLGDVLAAPGPGYVPPDSVLERRFLRVLERGRLPRPALQAPLPWRPSCPNRVDGIYAVERVIVECDGRRWHGRNQSMAEDRSRDREAQLHGYQVYRFLWEDITNHPEMVCSTLRQALKLAA